MRGFHLLLNFCVFHIKLHQMSCVLMSLCNLLKHTFLYLQHIELNEPPSKDSKGPNDAHCHEDAQQDVVQHHGNKLPLLCRLQWNRLHTHLTLSIHRYALGWFVT